MGILNDNMKVTSYSFLDDNQTIVEVQTEKEPGIYESFMVPLTDPSNEDYQKLMEWTSLENLQRSHEEAKKAYIEKQRQIEDHTILLEENNRLRQLLEDSNNSVNRRLREKEDWKKKALTIKDGVRTSRERVVYKDQDIMEVLNKDLNREDLFALKISIFEQPKVRNSQDKEVKSKIRKAKTTLEVLAAAAPLLLLEDQEENSE